MTPRDLLRILGEELRRRPYLIGFLVILAGLALWAIIPNPKRAIKRVIKRGEHACEARDIARLDAIMAADFQSDFAGDRDATLERLRGEFKEVESMEIRIKDIETDVDGRTAVSVVAFYIIGRIKGFGPFAGLEGDTNPLERCELRFIKEDDGMWRVSGVTRLGRGSEKQTLNDER